MLIRFMKFLYSTFLILVSLISFPQENNYVDRLCNKYEDWFASDSIQWNFEDSLASLEYRNKLFDLYQPIKEIFFNGAAPYNYIYNIHNYDTYLLFTILKLYADSKEEFDRQIGIPLNLATRLINNDAFIIGTVVDKIDHYQECRLYTTTCFVRTDSVVFSYFPIEVGDTVLIHAPLIGYYGYCQKDTVIGYHRAIEDYDFHVGDSASCFYLNRNGFVRFHQYQYKPKEVSKFSANHKDPFCSNSFVINPRTNNGYCKSLKETDQKKLSEFIKRIKTWKK